jgi:hypothetical protein
MEKLKTALGGFSKISFIAWEPELLGKTLIA